MTKQGGKDGDGSTLTPEERATVASLIDGKPRRGSPIPVRALERLRAGALQVAATRCGCVRCISWLENGGSEREFNAGVLDHDRRIAMIHVIGLLAGCDFEIASRLLDLAD